MAKEQVGFIHTGKAQSVEERLKLLEARIKVLEAHDTNTAGNYQTYLRLKAEFEGGT